jgi:hypothetical protein
MKSQRSRLRLSGALTLLVVALASIIHVGCQQGATSPDSSATARSPVAESPNVTPTDALESDRAYVEPTLEVLGDLLPNQGAPKTPHTSTNKETTHAGAACDVAVVWDFVDEARRRYAGCQGFPSDNALHQVSCADVEWMMLDSGCILAKHYFKGPMLETVDSRHTTGWRESYCQLRENHAWRSFVTFDAAGKIACHPTDATCRLSRDCTREGLCEADGARCKATLHSHCKDSAACANDGRCAAANGVCRAESDTDCAQSRVCKDSGKCSAVGGSCEVTSDADCRQSEPCKQRGECTTVDGACRATSDADCKTNDVCKNLGLCRAIDGVCVPTSTEECARSQPNTVFVAGGCYPASSLNCAHSDLCQEQGKCIVDWDNHSCQVASDEACSTLSICIGQGRCSAADGLCKASADADCEKSSACEREGKCTAVDGRCVATETTTIDPRAAGRWVQVRGGGPSSSYGLPELAFGPADRFVAGTRGCEETEACKKHGLCNKQGEYCVATKESCTRSKNCKNEGFCSLSPLDGGQRYCARATDADCKQSKLCEDEGKCRLRGAHTDAPECVSPDQIPSGCASSEVLVSGECRLKPTFDCAKTKACTEHGFGCQTRVVRTHNGTKLAQPFAQCVNDQDYCAQTTACSERGQCQTNPESAVAASSQLDALYECIEKHGSDNAWCFNDFEDPCLVTDSACKKSTQCEKEGRCAAWEHYNECWPENGRDCAQSKACEVYGYCGQRYRSPMAECAPAHTVDCLQSKRCRDKGLCKFDPKTDTCVEPEEEFAKTDPCAKTEACEHYGRCTTDVRSGVCVARYPQDCQSSQACEVYGRCAVIDGMCRPAQTEDCQRSARCNDGGRCELRLGTCQTETVAAALDAVCTAHERCEGDTCAASRARTGCAFPLADESGATRDEAAQPPASPEHREPKICALTDRCRERGDCGLKFYDYHYDGCMPVSDADCAQSEACEQTGACGMVHEERWHGGGAPSYCSPTQADHCAQAQICADEGRCATIQTDVGSAAAPPPKECMAASDQHCRQSKACKADSRCTARAGRCVES